MTGIPIGKPKPKDITADIIKKGSFRDAEAATGTMKNSKILRYFKNTLPFIIAGAVLVIIGILIYWYSFEIWVLGTPIAVAGAVLLVIGFALRTSDSNYTMYFETKVEDMKSGHKHDDEPIYKATEYSFDNNKYSKLDSAQKPRSEIYIETDIYMDKKQVRAEIFTVNAADETTNSEVFEYPLASVSASVREETVRCAGAEKKISKLTLSAPDCKSCEFPVRYNDIDVDQLVGKINDAKNRI